MQIFLAVVAIAIGHFFAYVDSRPQFDDAGVLAMSVAIVCTIIAFVSPRRPWLWGLLVGVWIPLHNILHNGKYGSLLALVFAFGGAYLGAVLRNWLPNAGRPS